MRRMIETYDENGDVVARMITEMEVEEIETIIQEEGMSCFADWNNYTDIQILNGNKSGLEAWYRFAKTYNVTEID